MTHLKMCTKRLLYSQRKGTKKGNTLGGFKTNGAYIDFKDFYQHRKIILKKTMKVQELDIKHI